MVSTKHIYPWVLGFVVSNTTDNSQWENYNLLDVNFRSLNKPRNPPTFKNDFTVSFFTMDIFSQIQG